MALILSGDTGPSFNQSAAMPVGSVLQVVNVIKTDTFASSATGAWTDITGLTVSITPKFNTSKIFVMATVYGSSRFNSSVRMVRDSTAIFVGNAGGSRPQVSTSSFYTYVDANISSVQPINGLDSPATTSATTYKIQFWQVGGGASFTCNRSQNDSDNTDTGRGVSTITLMEIAA